MGSRNEATVFIKVATKAFLDTRSSMSDTKFSLENADELMADLGSGHATLREIMGEMDEHTTTARALCDTLGEWIKDEQGKINVPRADMESKREAREAILSGDT